MNNEKNLDAMKFKMQLQENAWKKTGAKNLHEYVEYVNKVTNKLPSKKNIKTI
ncbi:hypothetical protein [Methanobrevibacter filiformis]|uniref:Uncharacterized protein n=1 Tax=Methanobrevibacter filiformis TaxID=55758 RepID=A0A166AJ94_9EURY|nr:hypothetical protein [Methanobrevibacter filiformis]KZX12099.1 hypothetical protein MBFIL_12290 [Methanobrevibacter filiformis]